MSRQRVSPASIKANNERHDRMTITMKKGYKQLIRKAADELNRNPSQLVREALTEYISLVTNRMSDDVRRDLAKLRRQHGSADLL